MKDTDVIDHVKELCEERGWSYYQLALKAGIPYSTLNNMLHHSNIPTVPTLQKICNGLEITLPDFFAGAPGDAHLSKEQETVLEVYSKLNRQEKQLFLAYGKGLGKIAAD